MTTKTRPTRAVLVSLTLFAALVGSPAIAAPTQDESSATSPQQGTDKLIVYMIDHQYIDPEELVTIQREIEAIFEQQAGLEMEWQMDASPRRELRTEELRVILLASDGTRWFHGPSNVIGLAPHDDDGIGRNCFVFYRQAQWFWQQAVLRCREATRERTQATARGETPAAGIDQIAPADCGNYLPSLTPLIVARAAAHEMVHILLNKLDHSPAGLMRDSFNLMEWLAADQDPFRLLNEEVVLLRTMLSNTTLETNNR